MPVTVSGLDATIAKLEGLDDPSVFRRPMNQSVAHLHNKVATYPSDSGAHRPQPFKTDKSRRFFFAALKRGDIEVPYRRGQSPGSEKLGTSWTTEVSADGRQGIVGNDTTYGPLVQDAERQTAYHATTGWKTAQTVVAEETDEVVGFFDAQYARYVND